MAMPLPGGVLEMVIQWVLANGCKQLQVELGGPKHQRNDKPMESL